MVGLYVVWPGEHIKLFTIMFRWLPDKKYHTLKRRLLFCKTAPSMKAVFLKTALIVWCYFWSLLQHSAQRLIPKMA